MLGEAEVAGVHAGDVDALSGTLGKQRERRNLGEFFSPGGGGGWRRKS